MERKPNTPNLDKPPYCKAVIEYIEDKEQKTKIVKGFQSIEYLYPSEHPNRISVLYSESQDHIPDDAEWVGDEPDGGENSYELIFHEARIKSVVFEEKWENNPTFVEE